MNRRAKHFGPALLAGVLLAGCEGALFDSSEVKRAAEAQVTAAGNFEVNRRVAFHNLTTGKRVLLIEGRCNVSIDGPGGALGVICKVGEKEYLEHILSPSGSLSYIAEHVPGADWDKYHHRVVWEEDADSVVHQAQRHADLLESSRVALRAHAAVERKRQGAEALKPQRE